MPELTEQEREELETWAHEGWDIVDETAPEMVEVEIRADGQVVWVSVNGITRFRACRIKMLKITDHRRKGSK